MIITVPNEMTFTGSTIAFSQDGVVKLAQGDIILNAEQGFIGVVNISSSILN